MLAVLLAIVGLAVGFGADMAINKQRMGSAEEKAQKELARAKKEAEKLVDEAREEAKKAVDETRKELKGLEERLVTRE